MATSWEKAAHSVNRMFSLLCLFSALIVSHFGFEGRTLVLIASVAGHYLGGPFTFYRGTLYRHPLLICILSFVQHDKRVMEMCER